jgi:hypothetical protein
MRRLVDPRRFRRTSPLVVLALGVVLMHPWGLAFGDSKKETPPKEAPKEGKRSPRLLLNGSPVYGFAPLNIQLVATLTGIDPVDPNYCHAAVTWVRVDPGTSPEKETRLTEAPRCLHDENELHVTTTFSKNFEISYPGSYLYRISVTGKDGREIRSNYLTVRVLRVP